MGGAPDPGIDAAFLAGVPVFGGLPERALAQLAAAGSVRPMAAGEEVFAEGEPASSMFVVHDGELEICKRGRNGAEFCLAVLRAGDCVGEMSLIDIQLRSATARAVGPVSLYVLDQAEIAKLYETDLEVYTLFVLNLAREISRRLRCADQALVDIGVAMQGVVEGPAPLTRRRG